MKILSKLTFFRVVTLSGFILSGAFPPSLMYAQDNAGKIEVNSECDFALSEGVRYNESNLFFRTIELLAQRCPPESYSREEEIIQAHELIALAYIGAEYPEKARPHTDAIREIDELYLPGQSLPSMYIAMYPVPEAKKKIDRLESDLENVYITLDTTATKLIREYNEKKKLGILLDDKVLTLIADNFASIPYPPTPHPINLPESLNIVELPPIEVDEPIYRMVSRRAMYLSGAAVGAGLIVGAILINRRDALPEPPPFVDR